MKIASEQNFIPNRKIEVNSLSYSYSDDPSNQIEAMFNVSIDNFEDLDRLKFKVAFGNLDTDNPTFVNSMEMDLVDYLTHSELKVLVPVDVLLDDLFCYLTIYNSEKFFLQKYNVVFTEQILSNGELITNNFVDLRIFSSKSIVVYEKSQKEVEVALYKQSQKDLFKYSYISNLFYSPKKNGSINCFFGVDEIDYFKDNNFLTFLNKDPQFLDYLNNNDFIISGEGYVYSGQDASKIDPVRTQGYSNIESDFGTLHQINFTPVIKQTTDSRYGYRTSIFMKNAITEYSLEVLRPRLTTEFNFLNSILINGFVTIQKEQIQSTISGLKAIFENESDNLGDLFVLWDNSTRIALNDSLRRMLIEGNEKIVKLIVDGNEINRVSNSPTIELTKDFGTIIDASKIGVGIEVVTSEVDNGFLQEISLEQFLNRSQMEVEKYFGEGQTTTTVQTKSGLTTVDLQALSYSYMTAESLYSNGVKVFDNTKALSYDFDYDDFLTYVRAINRITSDNLDYDFKIFKTPELERITPEEFNTEEQSKQLTAILNSMVVEEIPRFKNSIERQNYLTSVSNVIKTFEIPTTLRTDVCTDDVTQSDPRNQSITTRSANPDTFIGNNLLYFSVLSKMKRFDDKKFYEFYRYLLNNELNVDTIPVQIAFLYKFYREGLQEPSFLMKENLNESFVVYGLIYFMFKHLFKVSIYLDDRGGFVTLTSEILNGLTTGQDYLMSLDYYRDSRLGIETPKLLLESIYNKHFVLRA